MMSSTIIPANTSNSKSGGTIIQRRQRNPNSNNASNTNSNNGGVSVPSSASTYSHHHHHQQHHHNSYYFSGRTVGTTGIGMDGSSSSSMYHTDLYGTDYPVNSPPPPNHHYYHSQQQQQQQHMALHIDHYDDHTNHNHYPNNNIDNYDPEQPNIQSPFSSTHRMTEEQIRRFNYEQQELQQSTLPSAYHSTTPTTTITGITTTSARSIPIWKRKMVLEEDFYRIEDYHTIFRNPHHLPDAQYSKYVQLQQQYNHTIGGGSGNHVYNNNADNIPTTTTSTTSMMNKTCCAYTCSIFSAIAVIFLLWVGLLFDTQPLYIPGALPTITVQSVTQEQQQQQVQQEKEPPYSSTTNQRNNYKAPRQKGPSRKQSQSSSQQQQQQQRRTTPRIQFIIPGKNDERLLVAKTAYQAATMYFITMIISRYIYDPVPFHTFYNTYIVALFQRCCRRIGQRSYRHSYTDIPELQSYDMIGHYSNNNAPHSAGATSSSMEGFILAGGGANSNNNGISLLPYATSVPPPQRWFTSPYSTTATTSLWTRTTNTMKRYLASKGWYQPARRRNRQHYEIKKTG